MASILTTLRNSFSPLRLPNFRIYLSGQAVSLVGTWLQSTAQSWVVWTLTGSEAALGTVTLFNTLPILLLGPWAGVWADRLDRRKLLIGTQIAAMILAVILALLTQFQVVQLWHVYALALGLGIVTALDLPAQQAFLGDLSGMDQVRRAVNLNGMILQISRVAGPALAGIIVNRLGIAPAFWLNALSFLAVVFSLIAVRSSQVRSTSSKVNPLAQLGDALRFVRREPRMQDLYVIATLVTFGFWGLLNNVIPSIASKILNGNAETLGAILGASGAGALVSIVIIVPLAQAARYGGRVLTASALWLGVWLILFSFSREVPLSMLCMFMASMGAPIIFTMALGLIQLMAPADMRARLLSLFTMISFGMQPIAALIVGYIAEHIGVLQAVQFNGSVVILGALLLFIMRPDYRDWEVDARPSTMRSVRFETPLETH